MADDSKSLELQIRIATQEALKAVETLKGEIKALANEAKNYAQSEGEELKQSFKEAEAEAKKTATSIDGMMKAIGSLAEVAAATKALGFIKDLGGFALKTADDFQTMRNQFGILIGDMEAGAGLFNEIKQFGDITPFDLSTLTQATNVLIAAKVPLEDLQSQLTKFGDLSQGNSQRMTSYVNAFSQAAAKGKADMQILNTYLNQGVPILDALAKNFGVTTAEVVEMSSQGKISFEDFSAALDDLTAAGGRYFGGMELASQSLQSMQEGLQEAVNSLAASYGEIFMPVALAVVGVLTDITNAINESPLLKGLLIGAVVALTGYLAAMAVKAGIAFAAQMALNFAIGALNPAVLATTIAVAAIAGGYTVFSSQLQRTARDAENYAFEQAKLNNGLRDGRRSIEEYRSSLGTLTDYQLIRDLRKWREDLDMLMNRGIAYIDTSQIRALRGEITARRDEFIDSFYRETSNDQINELNRTIEAAQIFLDDINEEIRFLQEVRQDFTAEGIIRDQLTEIIRTARAEINKLNGDINNVAQRWLDAWAEFYEKWQIEQSNDPFAMIEYERRKKLEDAHQNYIRTGNQATLDQINEYYDAQRSEVIRQLAEQEESMQRQITRTKIDDLQHELQEALRAIDTLESQRIIAAGEAEEEIAAIREKYAQMREDLELQYSIDINKAKLDEARESVKNWQEELSDNLLKAMMDLQIFSDETAVILSDLTAQLIELSSSAILSGFEEFGRALGSGKDAAESLMEALSQMCQQILQQLPMMFLQAGLQLIANGQWAMGLGFIAAAGSSAFISGYVQGNQANANAHGNVFDEYGKAARAFAAGGTFTNQIVNQPTYFRYGAANLGVMGEAGPEAILPLKRMPSGNLGVETGGSGSSVIVTINNYSGAEVNKDEHEDADGNRHINIDIGEMINGHINSGKADRAMSGRYGIRAVGV